MKPYVIIVPAVLIVGGAGGWFAYNKLLRDPMATARAAMSRGDSRTALIELRNIVRSNPDNAEAHFRLGSVQIQLGDALAAEKEFKAAQSLRYNPIAIRPQLARAYLVQGRHKELLKDFPVEGLPPNEAGPLLVTRALAHLALNELDAADKSVVEAEKLAPTLSEAPLAGARVALARQDSALAEKRVNQALEINPKALDALLFKARILQARGDHEGELALYDRALLQAPDATQIRLERANAYLQANQDDRAKIDIDSVLKADPKNPAANYLQTFLLVRKQDWKAADEALQRVSMFMDRFPRAQYIFALVKNNLNQPEQAVDAAVKYVARAPEDPAGYKLLAQIHARAKRFPAAIETLNRAVASGHADAEILTILGAIQAQLGQVNLALTSLEKADKLNPDNPVLLARLGAMRLALGDTEGAARDYSRSLVLAPDQIGAAEALVVTALRNGEIQKAAIALGRLRSQKDANPEIVGNMDGLIKMANLDLPGAQAAYEAVLKDFPDSVMSRVNLAKLLTSTGKTDQAEALLRVPLAKDPTNSLALTTLTSIFIVNNQRDKAIALLEQGNRAAPTNLDFILGLASLYSQTGDSQKALNLLATAPKEQANTPRLLATRAQIQNAAGQVTEARQTMRQLLALAPSEQQVRVALANQLLADNQFDEARNVLREGLRIQPGAAILMEGLATVALRSGGLDAALTTVDQLWREPGNAGAARYLKGDLFSTLHRYDEAAAVYSAEMRLSPNGPIAVRTALALRMAGRPDQGAQILRDWLVRQPDDLDAARTLVSLDIEGKRLDAAEKTLLGVLEKRPNDAVALNNLAWIYGTKGDPKAVSFAQRAYILSPGAQSGDTFGWALVRQGKAAEGLVVLRQAARMAPEDLDIRYHLAAALKATGQVDEARAILTPMIESPIVFDEKEEARKALLSMPGK